MAVDNTSAFAGPYFANGTTTVFPFSFIALTDTEISVTLDGQPLDPTAYSVSRDATGAGAVTISPPLASGEVYIASDPEFTQKAAFQRFGPYFPDFINAPLDRSAVRDIYLRNVLARALVAPIGTDLVEYMKTLLGPAYQGAPGGNVMSVGSFATLSSLSIPDGTNRIRTAEGADYIYDAAVNPAYVTQYPQVAKITANTRGFRLDPRQRLTIEMFGGAGDAVITGPGNAPTAVTSGTDNLPAITAAWKYAQFLNNPGLYDSFYPFTPDVHFGNGRYWFSSLVEPRAVVRWVGTSTGHVHSGVPGGTVWLYPRASTALVLPNTDTDGIAGSLDVASRKPTAQGSYASGISFVGVGTGGTLSNHALNLRTRATIERCAFYNVAGDAIYSNASAGSAIPVEAGNANGSRIIACAVASAGGNGIHLDNRDANACVVDHFETVVCGDCGIKDTSLLGNYYSAPDIAGYGNGGVWRAGKVYQYIGIAKGGGSTYPGADGGAVTPGTNNRVWYYLREQASPSANFPAWISGTAYLNRLPILIGNINQRSVVSHQYIESGAVLAHVDAPSLVVGGGDQFTSYSPKMGANANNGMIFGFNGAGGRQTFPAGTPGFTNNGEFIEAGVGTPLFDDASDVKGRSVWSHNRALDGDLPWYYSYQGNRMVYQRPNRKIVFSVTMEGGGEKFGRATEVPYVHCLHDYGMVDPTSTATPAVLTTLRDGLGGYGQAGWGEWARMAKPVVGGAAMYVCTTAGTVGSTAVMQPVGIVGAVQATGLSSSSTAAQIVAALQAAKLVA